MASDSSDRSLGLYVHVPLCTDKCLYCDFYSVPRSSLPRQDQEELVRQTCQQMALFLEPLEGIVRTIYVGGGTPSALPRTLLQTLLKSLPGRDVVEWTVEANPETLDEAFLDACAGAGVTRLSVGVQSTDDRHLATLKRRARRADIDRALGMLASRWHGELSFDLITGIPGQKPADVSSDLEVLEQLRPGHFSLYQLTCEPGTPLARCVEEGTVFLNDPELDEELWFTGVDGLKGRGYQHYEISSFCQDGKECLHNLGYWQMRPYLGAGPGAVSTLPAAPLSRLLMGRGSKGVLRLSNPRSVARFLEGRPSLWGLEIEEVAPADFLLEIIMMGLRLSAGLDARSLRNRFGRSFEQLLPGIWERWVGKGLALPASQRLALSEGGRLLLDGLLKELAALLREQDLRGLTVSWP